jgi:hypothetical protein
MPRVAERRGGCAYDAGGGPTPSVDLKAAVTGKVLVVLGVGAATLATDRWKTGHPVEGATRLAQATNEPAADVAPGRGDVAAQHVP